MGTKASSTVLKYVSDMDYLTFIKCMPTVVYLQNDNPNDDEIIHNLLFGKQLIFLKPSLFVNHTHNVLKWLSSTRHIDCVAFHGESQFGNYVCIRKIVYNPKYSFISYFDPLALQASISYSSSS